MTTRLPERILDKLTNSEATHLQELLLNQQRTAMDAMRHVEALRVNKDPKEAFRLVIESDAAADKLNAFHTLLKARYRDTCSHQQ